MERHPPEQRYLLKPPAFSMSIPLEVVAYCHSVGARGRQEFHFRTTVNLWCSRLYVTLKEMARESYSKLLTNFSQANSYFFMLPRINTQQAVEILASKNPASNSSDQPWQCPSLALPNRNSYHRCNNRYSW